MRSLLLLVLGVTTYTIVCGMPFMNDLCPDILPKGTIHFPYSDDCEHFIQCTQDEVGLVNGTLMPCPFATYWRQESQTCENTDFVECPNDKCATKPNGIDRDDDRNCRGYWECENGKSVPKCCPTGQKFNITMLECVVVAENEEKCNATCFGEVYDASNETAANDTQIEDEQKDVECDSRTHPTRHGWYIQTLAGHPDFERQCGVGTVFDEKQCVCVLDTKPQAPRCTPEINLTFDSNNFYNRQDKGHYVGVQNVDVFNGKGYFNGESSKIVIPRFNNIEHVSTFVVSITYSSNASELVSPQTILSNRDCGDLPSIEIVEDDQEVIFTAGTTKDGLISTTVQQSPDTDQKVILYKFSSDQLIGTVNDVSTSMFTEGYLDSVPCALTIGGATSQASAFDGAIDNIKIYMCDPDTNPSPQ